MFFNKKNKDKGEKVENIVVFVDEVADGASTMYACIDKADKELVMAAFDSALSIMEQRENMNIENIVFIPTMNDEGNPTLNKIRSKSKMHDYVRSIVEDESKVDELNAKWEKFGLGDMICMGIIPIVNTHQDFGMLENDIRSEYVLDDNQRNILTKMLSNASGITEKDLFISKQVASFMDALSNDPSTWNYFFDQAEMKLTTGSTFTKTKYDEQIIPKDSFSLPVYGLFASCVIHFDRTARVEDYVKKVEQFHHEFINYDKDNRILKPTNADLAFAGDRICSPRQAINFYNAFSERLLSHINQKFSQA